MKNILFILTIFMFACQSGKENEIKEPKEEVMALHDEVMPKMSELRYARKNLMLQADSLAGSDSTRAAMLTALADDIAAANEGMMQWMHSFEPEFQGSEEEILQYLNEQKEAIQKVKDDMKGSLAKGQEVLDEN